MFIYMVLLWILIELSAPAWTFWFLGITVAWRLVELGIKLSGK